jgi:tryptophanyl-tRNA synthetase
MVPKQGATIMSLQNPEKKMSKTDDSKGCIGLFDEPKEIKEKIMAATTDSEKEVKYDINKKKGISNLLTIYSLFSGKEIKEIEKEFKGKGYGDFKKALAELLIEKLEPIREKRKELQKKPEYVSKVLENGGNKAREIAEKKMAEVRKRMGL